MIFGRGDGISGGAVRGRGVYICGSEVKWRVL